jgi:hypothetical protein
MGDTSSEDEDEDRQLRPEAVQYCTASRRRSGERTTANRNWSNRPSNADSQWE